VTLTLMHHTQTVELFGNIFAHIGIGTVCIKVLGKNPKGALGDRAS